MDRLPGVSAVAAARAVARVALTGDFRAPDPSPAANGESTPTELSAEARLLEHLLAWPAASGPPAAAPAGLLAQPPAPGPAAALAQALQQGLEQSGLFYESHLADWVRGERATAAVQAEPQGKLPPLPRVPEAQAKADTPTPAASAPLDHIRPASPVSETAPPIAGIVDPRAAPLVQQQLQTLDTQQLPWQGQLWPGQTMDWTVHPEVDPDQQGSPEVESAFTWCSTLRLALPQLGAIEAQLRLSAAGCALHLKVPAGQLPRLRAALPELAGALSGSGIRPERIVLSPDERPSHG